MKPRALILIALACAAAMVVASCADERPKTNEELGLNTQQVAGRAIFDHYCAACHFAYSARGNKGPGLKQLFHKQFLPSGVPANDRFVGQTIRGGRGMMPAFGDALTPDQFESLMAYLHTL